MSERVTERETHTEIKSKNSEKSRGQRIRRVASKNIK